MKAHRLIVVAKNGIDKVREITECDRASSIQSLPSLIPERLARGYVQHNRAIHVTSKNKRRSCKIKIHPVCKKNACRSCPLFSLGW